METNKDENKFYVYAYLDPRKPGKYTYGDYSFDYEPFYIGKGGTKRQMWRHLSETANNTANIHKVRKINNIKKAKLNPIVIVTKSNLSEEKAFKLEKKYITIIGRSDLKLGPLTNQTDGGEGASGALISEETRDKLIKSSTGRILSENAKNKIGKSNKGKSNIEIYEVTNPNGNIFYTNEGLRFFCEQNNLFHSNMLNVANGNQSNHKGWICKRLSPINKNKSTKANTKKHKLTSPTGQIFYVNGLKDFCKENNLQQSKISSVENGDRPHHKGWKSELIIDFVVQ